MSPSRPKPGYQTVREGWLMKSCSKRHTWMKWFKSKYARRYFVLRSTQFPGRCALDYYKDAEKNNFRNTIDLKDCTEVHTFTDYQSKYSFMVEMKTGKTSVVLVAKSAKEMTDWAYALAGAAQLDPDIPDDGLQPTLDDINKLLYSSPAALSNNNTDWQPDLNQIPSNHQRIDASDALNSLTEDHNLVPFDFRNVHRPSNVTSPRMTSSPANQRRVTQSNGENSVFTFPPTDMNMEVPPPSGPPPKLPNNKGPYELLTECMSAPPRPQKGSRSPVPPCATDSPSRACDTPTNPALPPRQSTAGSHSNYDKPIQQQSYQAPAPVHDRYASHSTGSSIGLSVDEDGDLSQRRPSDTPKPMSIGLDTVIPAPRQSSVGTPSTYHQPSVNAPSLYNKPKVSPEPLYTINKNIDTHFQRIEQSLRNQPTHSSLPRRPPRPDFNFIVEDHLINTASLGRPVKSSKSNRQSETRDQPLYSSPGNDEMVTSPGEFTRSQMSKSLPRPPKNRISRPPAQLPTQHVDDHATTNEFHHNQPVSHSRSEQDYLNHAIQVPTTSSTDGLARSPSSNASTPSTPEDSEQEYKNMQVEFVISPAPIVDRSKKPSRTASQSTDVPENSPSNYYKNGPPKAGNVPEKPKKTAHNKGPIQVVRRTSFTRKPAAPPKIQLAQQNSNGVHSLSPGPMTPGLDKPKSPKFLPKVTPKSASPPQATDTSLSTNRFRTTIEEEDERSMTSTISISTAQSNSQQALEYLEPGHVAFGAPPSTTTHKTTSVGTPQAIITQTQYIQIDAAQTKGVEQLNAMREEQSNDRRATIDRNAANLRKLKV